VHESQQHLACATDSFRVNPSAAGLGGCVFVLRLEFDDGGGVLALKSNLVDAREERELGLQVLGAEHLHKTNEKGLGWKQGWLIKSRPGILPPCLHPLLP